MVEAVDKVRRFKARTAFIAEAGMPFPAAEMVLVITLFRRGRCSPAGRYALSCAVAGLLIPTALLFESSESAVKSVSLMGALLLLMAAGPGRFALGGGY